MKRALLSAAGVLLLAALAFWAYRSLSTGVRERGRADAPPEGIMRELSGQESIVTEVNAKAPAFAAVTLDGTREVRSIDFIGQKTVLLEFWSVFCNSCIQEMPFLDELQRKYGADGLEVIGVNTDFFSRERILKFFERLEPRPNYPVIHDKSQEMSLVYNVDALPVTVLIDSSGWIRMYQLGYNPADKEYMERMVKKWTRRIRESDETVRPVDGKTPVTASGKAALKPGHRLPDLRATDEQGKVRTLQGYRDGRAMVLFFWSLFCQPCREEMPVLEAEAQRLGGDGEVAFLSVNLDAARLGEAVKRFLKKNPLPFPTLLDASAEPAGSLARELKISSTPTLILVDTGGTVAEVIVGGLAPDELRKRLEALVLAAR